MSLFASHCLACRAREPTHDRGGMLDVVATRDDIPAPVVDVIDVDLSDHHLLRWPMTSARPSPTYVSSVRRLWRRVNVDDLRTAILVSRLAQPALLPDDADVDALAGIYDADMLAIADRLAPARTVTVDRRTRGSTTSVVPPNAPLVLPSASLGARRRQPTSMSGENCGATTELYGPTGVRPSGEERRTPVLTALESCGSLRSSPWS
jgi:hypothetical protein